MINACINGKYKDTTFKCTECGIKYDVTCGDGDVRLCNICGDRWMCIKCYCFENNKDKIVCDLCQLDFEENSNDAYNANVEFHFSNTSNDTRRWEGIKVNDQINWLDEIPNPSPEWLNSEPCIVQ